MRKLLVFLGVALLAATLGVQSKVVRMWSFDADKTDAIPPGFTNAVGEWKVVADNTAPSKPNVLAQRGKSERTTFNVTLIRDTNYKDVDISVKMKAVAGQMDQGGGVVWRAKDAKNYYIARYNPLEDNYRVYKVKDGKRTQLQSADIKRTDGWHTLRVTMQDDHIQGYYDGKKYLDCKDSTFKDAGKVGLWTKADAQTHFDDLTVSGK
ncbi:MAG: DUF1080 domain-containing protein [Abditibacteriales bacterium]|nr:DUF1080 domain-containing protein [Abditibacteriales bacterium]MDW8365635.1 DUF1080 domain-containing protein [Abditibacteriales bacterium]